MTNTKNKKETPVFSEYPKDIIAPKIPTTKKEIAQAQKENIEYLLSRHKYDTLRSHTILINGYHVPVYSLYFETLRLEYRMEEMPLNEYAAGYLEGIKTEFIPYIDTPENIRELVTEALAGKYVASFPISLRKEGDNFIEYLDPHTFYEYGIEIGKQKKAWDIVLESKNFFKDFLDKEMGNDKVTEPELSIDEMKPALDALVIEPQTESPDPYQFVKDTLKPLSGKWWLNDMLIMTDQEYSRLINYTVYMIEHKKLPTKSLMIARTSATTEFIRKTFHRLFQHTHKAVPRNLYCQFLQKIFGQFKDLELKSITQNFSRFDGGKYDEIVGIIVGKIEK